MEFAYTAAQRALQKEVQDFIAKEITEEIEEEQEELGSAGPKVKAVYDKIRDKGWRAISWPKQYGGQEIGRAHV